MPGLRPLDAAAMGALAWSTRRARTRAVAPGEERVFRAVNELPDSLHAPVWVVMQSGSLAAVHVVAAVTLRRRGPRPAAWTAIVGTAVWGGVKLVKPLVGRGRPARHLRGVQARGKRQTGLGYPSGHAAVATTLALVATSGGRARPAAMAVAAITGMARMYVGAHLPHDVLGGFAIGTLVGRATGRLGR